MNMYLLHNNAQEVSEAVGGLVYCLPYTWEDGRLIISVGKVIDGFGNRSYPVPSEELAQWVSLFGEENFITHEQLPVQGGVDGE